MASKNDNSPVGFSIKELAEILPISRNALHQRCCRMHKRENKLYFRGVGWYSITKPGREYVLFLIQSDKDSEREIKGRLCNLLESAKSYVCSDCVGIIQTMIDNIK